MKLSTIKSTIHGTFCLLSLLFVPTLLNATTNGNKGITFQGVIKDTSDPASPTYPTVTSNVIVQVLGVRSDGNSCILWQETHSSVTIEKGYLYLVVGRGTKSPTPTLSFKEVFDDSVKTGLNCSNGFTDYTPAATDSRKLRVVVSSLSITADFNMRSAPMAVYAENAASAETVGGKASTDFVNINNGAGVTQSAVEAWFSSTVMTDILAGTYNAPTATTATNVSGVVAIANGGTGANNAADARTNLGLGPLAVMSPAGTADANSYLRGDGTWAGLPSAPTLAGDVSGAVGTNTVDKIKGTAVNTTGMADGHFLRFDSGAWINGTLVAADVPDLDWAKITTGKPTTVDGYGITDAVKKTGDTMSGALNMGSNDVTATGYVLMSPQRALGLGTYTNAQETTLTGGLSAAHKGYTWFNSDANEVKYWDGTAALALGVAGSGITSIGGQTGGAQSFATGTTGTTPTWSSGSDTHTLNIPMASAAGVTAGLISRSEFDTFSAKLDAATTFGGDVTGTYNAIVLNTVPVAKGGTGQTTAAGAFNALSPLTTKGDVLVHDGTTNARIGVGSDGKALIADSSDPNGIKWGDIFATDLLSMVTTGIVQRNGAGSYSSVTVNGPLTYSAGALGVNVGTGAGSVAAGDDSRIVGALQRSGGTMTGAIDMGSNDLTATGYVLMSPQRALGLGTYTNAQETTLVGTLNATHKGYTWFNSDADQVKYWNGAAAQALGIAGAGITSFGGQSGNSQSLAVGTSGLAPAWNSASDTHTLNIPMASAAGVTAGLLNKTDYDAFAAKQPAGSYMTALTGDVTAAGPGSAAATIAAGAVNSSKILDGTIVAADMDFTGVNNATSGFAVVDATGKFYNFACSTAGDVPTWTAGGFACQAPVPLLPDLNDGTIWVGNGSNDATAVTMSGDATLSNAGALTLANSGVTAGTYSKVTVDAKGRVTVGANIASGDVTTALGFTPLNKAGDVMTGLLGLNGVASDPGGLTGADEGKMWFRTDTNEIKYWNGSTAIALGVAGAGITSFGGQSGNSQSLAIGTSGLAPAWSSASDTHTLNIPMASAAGVTAGLLNKTDYDSFAAKQPAGSYVTALTGDVTAAGPGSAAATIAANAVTSAKIANGTIVGADIDFTGVNTATSGFAVVDATGKFYNFACATTGHVPTWTAAGFACQAPTPLLPTLADGKVWIGNGANAATAQTVSGDATLSNTGALTLANSGVTAGTYSKVTVDAKGRVTVGANIASGDVTTALGFTPLNKAGDVMTGLLGLNGVASDPGGLTGADEGKVWFRTDTNEIKYWNGSAAVALGVSGAGLTSLNGQTGSTQTFATPGTSGLAPAWSSAGNAHTLNIPMAATASVTAGLISKTEYDSFAAKQPAGSYVTALTGDVTAAGPGSAAATIAAGAVNSSKIADGTIVQGDMDFTGVNTATTSLSMVDSTGKFFEFACSTTGHVPTWTVAGFACQAPVSGITSLNGLSTTTQTFATPDTATGTAPAWSSSGSAHTLQIPMASVTGVTAGLISKTDYDAFNGKVGVGSGVTGDVIYATGATTWTRGTPNAAGLVDLASPQTVAGAKTFQAGDNATTILNALTVQRIQNNSTAPSAGQGAGLGFNLEGSTNNTFIEAGKVATVWEQNQTDATTARDSALTFSTSLNATVAEKMRITSAGYVGIGTVNPGAALEVNGQVKITGGTPGAGKVLTSDAAGLATWTTPSAGGITSMNGLSGATQTFATGTSGTDFNISSATTVHTFNFPSASASNRGLLTSADWTTFNGKLSATITTPATGQHIRYNGTTWVNAAVNAATDMTGILPVANGGTGASSLGTGNLLVGAGTGAVTSLAGGAAGNVLYTSGINTWASATPDTAGLVDKSTTQTISGAKAFTNYIQMAAQNLIRFADSDSDHYVAIRAPATVTTDFTLTLPTTAGGAGNVLSTDGAGNLSWIAAGGTGDFKADGTVNMTGTIKATAGTAALPGYTFVGDTNNGIFAPAADVVGISTAGSERLRVDATGNVGIGTTTPSYLLQVRGSNPVIGLYETGSSTDLNIRASSSGIDFRKGGVSYYHFNTSGDGLGVGTIPIAGNSITMSYGGKIGTTRMSAYNTTFEATGTTSGTTNSNGGTLILKSGISTGTGSSNIDFYTAAAGGSGTADNTQTVKMSILGNGNVGIGTTSPTSILDVNGAQTMRGMAAPAVSAAGQGRIYFDSTANKYKVSQNGGAYADLVGGSGDFKADGTVAMTGAFRAADGSAVSPSISFANATGTGFYNLAGNMIFSHAGSNKFGMDGGSIYGLGGGGWRLNHSNTAASPAIAIGDTDTGLFSPSADSLSVSTAGTERLRVDSSGNVGIGTNAPGAPLEIANNGLPRIGLNNISGGVSKQAQVLFQKNGTSTWSLESDRLVSGTQSFSIVDKVASLTRVHIDSSGNVGIGTTAPTSILDINGAETMRGMAAPAVSAAGQGRIYFDSTANKYKVSQNGGAYADLVGGSGDFKADGSIPMTGQLQAIATGVAYTFAGDTDTGMKRSYANALEFVTGGTSAAAFNDIQQLYFYSGGSALFPSLVFAGNSTGIWSSGANTLNISTGGVERFRVDSTGKVGIGTTSPASALHVVGDIQYTGTLTDISDRRLKTNIQSLEEGLSKIRRVRVYSYVMKDDPTQRTEFGVMAQDMMNILPDLVKTVDANGTYYGVNYMGLIPWTIKAVQEVDSNTKKIQRELASVKEENKSLQDSVKKLEEQNRRLEEKMNSILSRLEK